MLGGVLTVTYSLADQNFLTTKSVGIFNLSTQLLHQLLRQPDLRLTVLTNPTLGDTLKSARISHSESHPEAIGGRFGRVLWDQWGVYRAAQNAGNEWLLLPKGFASFTRRCPVKLAVYVHDTILESYYRRMPGMSLLEIAYFRRCFRANLLNARLILTNSNFTCEEVTRAATSYGLKPPPLANVGIGFEVPGIKVAPKDTVMVLASSLPHKRTALALQYMTNWQQETGFKGKVVWVGKFPEGLAAGSFANWRHSPRLPERGFRELLHSSNALVFFSDYEGFGMPPVEAALACACPVYSAIPATTEVMRGAGVPFQNGDYNDFSRALNTALKVPVAQREVWRDELAARYSWAGVASKVVTALRGLSCKAG